VDIGPWWSVLALTGAGLLLLARPGSTRAERITGLPWQIYRIATDSRLRRNHALEHATLHVLTERHGQPQLNGVAVQAGFIVRGLVNPKHVVAAAAEGLERLRAGETSLAYHPRCGTSLGTADLLTWLILVILLAMTGRLTWIGLGGGMAIAVFGGPVLGRWVQRHLTTSVDLSNSAIAGMTVQARPAPRGASLPASPDEFWGEIVVIVHHADDVDADRRENIA